MLSQQYTFNHFLDFMLRGYEAIVKSSAQSRLFDFPCWHRSDNILPGLSLQLTEKIFIPREGVMWWFTKKADDSFVRSVKSEVVVDCCFTQVPYAAYSWRTSYSKITERCILLLSVMLMGGSQGVPGISENERIHYSLSPKHNAVVCHNC